MADLQDAASNSSFDEAVIVKAENLGKCYRIFDRPQDRLKQAFFQNRRQYYREFWALRHVDFELRRGETLGIIGRNGSGKSTLLQLLCGTLTPTEGRSISRGRVAALLELGSGFNPEFTGLENVYLYASLLGLNRQETDARLDAILGFADIGDFISQPVKTYSSGMAVRLAFAVIANVDADILVVDEALSVGDVFFVQKCMRFIQRFKEQNTLILVTHDAQAALTVCSHGLVLSQGRMLTRKIEAKKAIQAYVDDFYFARSQPSDPQLAPADRLEGGESASPAVAAGVAQVSDPERADAEAAADQLSPTEIQLERPVLVLHGRSEEDSAIYAAGLRDSVERLIAGGRTLFTQIVACEESGEFGNDECKITLIRIANTDLSRSAILAEAERVEVAIEAVCLVNISQPILGFAIRNRDGLPILGENTYAFGSQFRSIYSKGEVISARFIFTMPRLSPGQYTIHAAIARGTQADHIQMHYFHDVCAFEVVSMRPCNALSCPSDMMVEVI